MTCPGPGLSPHRSPFVGRSTSVLNPLGRGRRKGVVGGTPLPHCPGCAGGVPSQSRTTPASSRGTEGGQKDPVEGGRRTRREGRQRLRNARWVPEPAGPGESGLGGPGSESLPRPRGAPDDLRPDPKVPGASPGPGSPSAPRPPGRQASTPTPACTGMTGTPAQSGAARGQGRASRRRVPCFAGRVRTRD